MRLKRETIELMYAAIQDTAAEEFVLDLDAAAKLQFAAVETVEKVRPLSLTKVRAGQRRRAVAVA